MNFIFYFITFGLCLWISPSYSTGPSLDDLEKKVCPPHKPLICIPYGACCSHSEFCHAGLCESCFYDRVLTNLLEWCREHGQYNVSQMRSSSCRFACHDRFTSQELSHTKNVPVDVQQLKEERELKSLDKCDTSTFNDAFIVPTFALVLIIAVLLILMIGLKVLHRLPNKLKGKLKRRISDTPRSTTTPSSHAGTAQNKTSDNLQVVEVDTPILTFNKNKNPKGVRFVGAPVVGAKSYSTLPNIGIVEINKNISNSILAEVGIEGKFVNLNKQARGGDDLHTKDQKVCFGDGTFEKLQVAGCEAEEGDPLLQKKSEGGANTKKPIPKQEEYKVIVPIPDLSSTDMTTEALAVEERLSNSELDFSVALPNKLSQPTNRRASLGPPFSELPRNRTNIKEDDFIHVNRRFNEEMEGNTRDPNAHVLMNIDQDAPESNFEDEIGSLDISSKGFYDDCPTIDKSKTNQDKGLQMIPSLT